MLEIINDVLNSEERAEKLLQEARDEAARMQREFSERESREIREYRERNDQRLREKLSAIRAAEEKRCHEAAEVLRKKESDFSKHIPDGMDEAVELSVRTIVSGPGAAGKGGKAGTGA